MPLYKTTLRLIASFSLLLLVGCAAKDSDARTKIGSVLTNRFGIHLPGSLTNAQSKYYTYSSMDGGARVWLQLLSGDSAAASNVLQQLEAKKITILNGYSPIEDRNAVSHASWWHPEKHGTCDVFMLSADEGNVGLSLNGYVFSTPTNSSVFLILRESAK